MRLFPGEMTLFKMDQAGDAGAGGGAGEAGDGGNGAGSQGDDGGAGDGQGSNAPGGTNAKGSGEGDQGSGDFDLSALDEKTQNYIKGLRKENAKYRTSAKETTDRVKALEEQSQKRDKALKAALGIEGDDEIPVEERLEASQMENASIAFENETLKLAIANGISGDGVEYFQFLVQKEVSNLEEGEELGDEALESIIQKAKGFGGGDTAGKGNGSTSVNGKGSGNGSGGNPDPSSGGDTIGVDDFARMTFTQKGQLFGKNPDLYKKLNAEAAAKGLI